MKKKLLIIGAFMMLATYGFSQFEIKTNPIGLLFNNLPISFEYVVTDNIGLEITGAYTYGSNDIFASDTKFSGLNALFNFKYYFGPNMGGDRFYAFPYLRYVNRTGKYTDDTGNYTVAQNVFGVGFGAGYKWVAESGLLFDFGLGAGKNFMNEVTYSDPNYDDESVDLGVFNFNFIGRISIGYRFGM